MSKHQDLTKQSEKLIETINIYIKNGLPTEEIEAALSIPLFDQNTRDLLKIFDDIIKILERKSLFPLRRRWVRRSP